jgi:origin recognition complex subunit 4
MTPGILANGVNPLFQTNYADTMASLLALLSHPSEITGEDQDAHVTSQAVVFVIDEFDMFAYHPRQTLLYNLFDIAQSRKAPIAVLGCTTRVDVVEMLEKRVKSRFSHRYVFVPPARGMVAYWEICRQGLLVRKEDAEGEGMDTELEGHGEFMEYWSKKIEVSSPLPLFLPCSPSSTQRKCVCG